MTKAFPAFKIIPKHIAIVMDGNGRWAKAHGLDRSMGHKKGGEVARQVVQWCGEMGVEVLTLFAFGSDNWRRPPEEVNLLMELFLVQLKQETPNLHKNSVRLTVIGDKTAFSRALQKQITESERITAKNTGLHLQVAANYGGYWDICTAAKACTQAVLRGELTIDEITPEVFSRHLATGPVAPPDLFIRTSGEQRISNFMLWQLSYTELYFSRVMWPEFSQEEFMRALEFFSERERRFGCISEQLA